jgi:hypothetical protein
MSFDLVFQTIVIENNFDNLIGDTTLYLLTAEQKTWTLAVQKPAILIKISILF